MPKVENVDFQFDQVKIKSYTLRPILSSNLLSSAGDDLPKSLL